MSCRPRYRHPIGPVAIVVVLLTLLAATGCGRKGDPLPPLREPDPIAESAPSEAEAGDSESSESQAEDDDDNGEDDDNSGETGSDSEPNDGGDDDGTPP